MATWNLAREDFETETDWQNAIMDRTALISAQIALTASAVALDAPAPAPASEETAITAVGIPTGAVALNPADFASAPAPFDADDLTPYQSEAERQCETALALVEINSMILDTAAGFGCDAPVYR
jgi:hypothetical protein